MSQMLEVLFAPAEQAVLNQRDLSQVVCVVFDVLRATTTMLTALANGAECIIPVAEIPEALAYKAADPGVLLAGERDGVRILAGQTGGVDFDLGNSPREFTAGQVRGRRIVMSTTNGTRALRACAGAESVLVSSFLNLRAVARWIEAAKAQRLLLVCSGTVEQAAYEDSLAAGALTQLVWNQYAEAARADSAYMARELFRLAEPNLLEAIRHARNGRRLLSKPDLRGDVPFCAERDSIDFVAALGKDGAVRRIAPVS